MGSCYEEVIGLLELVWKCFFEFPLGDSRHPVSRSFEVYLDYRCKLVDHNGCPPPRGVQEKVPYLLPVCQMHISEQHVQT